MTRCDLCGDVSNSEPGLMCGRVDEDENGVPLGPPCPGTYRPTVNGSGQLAQLTGRNARSHLYFPLKGGPLTHALVDTLLVARSGNTKTGPIPVTYRTQATCPTACPFLPTNGGGCYASGRIFALAHRGASTLSAEDARERLGRREAVARYLRDRVAGDLVKADGTFDWEYLESIAALAREAGLTPFGYTHAWRLLTKRDVRRIRKLGYVLNASCENEADVRAATKLGLPTVLTGNGWTDGDMLGARRVVTCLAQTRDTDCASCGLCAKPDRAATVRFLVHGPARARARATVAALTS